MSRRMTLIFMLGALPVVSGALFGAATPTAYFQKGTELYNAGRFSDATEAFEMAVKKKDHPKEAQAYMERIRKETVERIRNRALTGVSKDKWQTKYYYINTTSDGRIRVGISTQEAFERDSTNFRPGALDALNQLAVSLAKADTAKVDIDYISEIRTETPVDPQVVAQQEMAIFSYMSLIARGQRAKY
jgi:hypothetical protein